MGRKILLAVAALLVLAGGLLMYGSNFAADTVSEQLAAQNIKFPPASALEADNPSLVKYAEQEVNTGEEAKAYSEYIKGHLEKVADGKTYSEVSSEYQKDKTNEKLAGQRTSLFMGETLRGLLLNAWGWGLVGEIAMYAAYAVWVVAAAIVVCVFMVLPAMKPVKKSRKSKR